MPSAFSVATILHIIQTSFLKEKEGAEDNSVTLKNEIKCLYKDLCVFLKTDPPECQSNDPLILINSIKVSLR